jgi:DNA-binding response OmpR family regulator
MLFPESASGWRRMHTRQLEKGMRFLVADDNPALGMFLARGLESEGHSVTVANDGQVAVDRFLAEPPDLTILELNLPRKDGAEVLRFIRSVTEDMPILILTARNEIETRVRCLDQGADDCMMKPFSLAELRARCRALLRRRRDTNLIMRHDDLQINRVERSVSKNGAHIVLTNKEFALLECLMLNRGRSVSRATLLERVWNMNSGSSTNVVDVYVNYLRRKLVDYGPNPLIQTVRGEGYAIGRQATPRAWEQQVL